MTSALGAKKSLKPASIVFKLSNDRFTIPSPLFRLCCHQAKSLQVSPNVEMTCPPSNPTCFHRQHELQARADIQRSRPTQNSYRKLGTKSGRLTLSNCPAVQNPPSGSNMKTDCWQAKAHSHGSDSVSLMLCDMCYQLIPYPTTRSAHTSTHAESAS